MPQLKTRQLLVDVARQLFAKQGLEGTTMNDIAEASEKEVGFSKIFSRRDF